jgi:hypothetical protein
MSAQIGNQELENISLYIPHMFKKFTGEYIAEVFNRFNIGMVDHVDFVPKIDRRGRPYNAAYVHFKHWFDGVIAANFQERVLNPNKEAHIVHDDPWYWNVLENTAKKPTAKDPTAKDPTAKDPTAKKLTDVEPKWVILSFEEEKRILEDIEQTSNENYVLKAELEKIREGDDAKINDMRVTIRKLQSQAKEYADEMHDLEFELRKYIRELEDHVAYLSNHNAVLREKVVEFSSLDEKQHNSLIDKQQQLIDATNKASELEVELNKSKNSIQYFRNGKLELEKLCRKILSPETDDLTQAKDDICRHLYYGLTYPDLMEKTKEEREEYWAL